MPHRIIDRAEEGRCSRFPIRSVDLELHLSITLDGDLEERTLADDAFLDDALETIQRLGACYSLRADKGESAAVRVSKERETTEVPPQIAPPCRPGLPGVGAGVSDRGTVMGSF